MEGRWGTYEKNVINISCLVSSVNMFKKKKKRERLLKSTHFKSQNVTK